MSELITPDELPRWVPGELTLDSAPLGWDGVDSRLSLYPFGRADPRDARLSGRRRSGRRDRNEPALYR